MGTKTKFHRDGSVTVWDVYCQQWVRTFRPVDYVLASLPSKVRDRVMQHCAMEEVL